MAIARIDMDFFRESDDDELYAYLYKTHPKGSEMISDEEQETLMAFLRKKCQSI